MRVISFACQKGAAGKTTLVGHVGVQAELAGAGPVVLLDTDQQGALAEWWNSRQPEQPAFAHAVIDQLTETIAQLRDMGFGLCIIDSASAISPTVEQVIAISDLVVIPCRPSPHDLRAATKTIDLVDGLGKQKVFVLNGATEGDRLTEEARAVLSEAGPVSPVAIFNHPDYADSMFDGLTVMETTPDGDCAREITALWDFLAGILGQTAPQVTDGPFTARHGTSG
ncbi:MAG: ParA family protein [Alphaproteobacteria bacterium]|nr:ParA family protein [Alphaproteobacteria bacterium]